MDRGWGEAVSEVGREEATCLGWRGGGGGEGGGGEKGGEGGGVCGLDNSFHGEDAQLERDGDTVFLFLKSF